ncbi:MAG TPA: hypothetical protein VL944_01480 [Candidatus Acidoferrum sp.]|nr:hypothetical protein [Candidatus Acidoferrum sp.]
MKRAKKPDWKFSSSFCVKGKLISAISEVEKTLGSVPEIKQVSCGETIGFELLNGGDGKQVVELDSSSVRLVFYFNEQNKRRYSACLLKFFSILAIVNDHYTFDIKPLYSYVIESLRWSLPYAEAQENDPKAVARLSWNLRNMTFANASLSQEIFENKRRMDDIQSKLADYGAFCKKVVGSLSQKNGNVLKDLEASFGIGQELGKKVCAMLEGG